MHGLPWGKIIPHLWLLNLQISQDEYTLFSANIFFRLRDNHLKGTSHRKE
jgi:hypothetical protein